MPQSNYAGRVRAIDTGAPLIQPVKWKANTVAVIGTMIVTVAGFGVVPAAANANTGKMAGNVKEATQGLNGTPGDNTGGADGDVTGTAEDGVYDYANHPVHSCSQADVGKTVYASDGITISNDATDGPPAGKLLEFNSTTAMPGRPCRVRLAVGPQAT